MSVYAAAKEARSAGLALALAFETLGDLELDEREITEDEVKGLLTVAMIASEACGQKAFSADELQGQFSSYQKWWAQDSIQVSDVGETLVAAAETLKGAWKKGSKEKKQFLAALFSLAFGDDKFTDNEAKSVAMVAAVMGASAELKQLLDEVNS
jgi:hypothetical protein